MQDTFITSLHGLSSLQFGLIIGSVTVISCMLLRLAIREFRNARFISDIPNAKLRSAAQGYNKLHGILLPIGALLTSPLTGKPCVWYHYRIERENIYYENDQRKSEWVLVQEESSTNFFLIDDGTGTCLITAAGADITTVAKDDWYSAGLPKNPNQSAGFLSLLGDLLTSGPKQNYHLAERRLHAGETLYALGMLQTLSAQNRDTFLARYPIKKNNFSKNLLDYWEQLSGKPLNFVSNLGIAGRPFILSSLPIEQLKRGEYWNAFLYSFLFLASTMILIYLLCLRM